MDSILYRYDREYFCLLPCLLINLQHLIFSFSSIEACFETKLHFITFLYIAHAYVLKPLLFTHIKLLDFPLIISFARLIFFMKMLLSQQVYRYFQNLAALIVRQLFYLSKPIITMDHPQKLNNNQILELSFQQMLQRTKSCFF